MVEDINYFEFLISENPKSDKAARFKYMNIESLINNMEMWENNPDNFDTGLYAYLNRITLLSRDDMEDDSLKGKVNLMTIHASKGLEFPVVFDWEIYSENGRNANLDPETVNACAIAFCEEIAKAGYEPMVYFNLDLANRFWDLETFQQKGYPFWLAMYRSTMNWPYEAQMWQYTETGRVDGIDTPVDLNLYFP